MHYVILSLLSLHTLCGESDVTSTPEPMYFDCRSDQCLYQSMICDDDRDCVVDCAYDNGDIDSENDEGCQNAVAVCGFNARCEVLCDGNESCDRLRIDGTRATELIVTCNDHHESCADAQILCPIYGKCIINADNINSDILNDAYIFAVNGLKNIELNTSIPLQSNISVYCGSEYEYKCKIDPSKPHKHCQHGGDMECESSLTLNVTLEAINSEFDCRTKRCSRQTLICHHNIECRIDCGYDDEACKHTFIICPDAAKCDVLCDGYKACRSMRVYASGSAELNITCGNHYASCRSVSIICPLYGKCNITGYNDNYDVFQYMMIYSMNGMDNIVFINSSSLQSRIYFRSGIHYEDAWDLYNMFDCRSESCYYGTMICHDEMDCIIDCGYYNSACKSADIHCPSNHRCNVRCSGSEACEYTTFYGTDSTDLHIICDDYDESCKGTEIYCPEMCTITGYNDDNDEFHDMNIFAVNGVNDVTFTLHNSTSLTHDIIIHCGSQYEYSCKLEQKEPFKYCQIAVGNDEMCDFNPTSQPSNNPIFSIMTSNTLQHKASLHDGQVIEATETIQYTDESQDNEQEQSVVFRLEKYWILLLFGAVLCIILCGVYVIYLRRKIMKMLTRQITNNIEDDDNDTKEVEGLAAEQNATQFQGLMQMSYASKHMTAQQLESGAERNGVSMDVGNDMVIQSVVSDNEGEEDHVTAGEVDDELNNANSNDAMDVASNLSPSTESVGRTSIDFVNAAEMDEVVVGYDETDIGVNNKQ